MTGRSQRLVLRLGAAIAAATVVSGACAGDERVDDRSVREWAAELRATDPARRARAAEAGARFAPRSPEAVQALLSAFANEGNADVHVALAATLGAIGPGARPAVPGLLRLLDDAHPEVRATMLRTLARLRATEATPRMIAALRDPDHDVRAAAADALGRMGAGAAVPAVIGALDDPISLVRLQAVEALGRLHPPADTALPALRGALRDPFEHVRRAACTALARYGPAVAATPGLVVDLRERAVHDEDAEVRRAAGRALEALGDLAVFRPADVHPRAP